MQIKQLPLLKWDKSWRMKPPPKKIRWCKKWKNTTKCLPKKRGTEKLIGSMISNLKTPLKLRELIWVILCKKISPQLNLSLLHTDLCHITSKDSERNKLKILLPKETDKLLMLKLQGKTNVPRSTSGQFRISQIPSINSITNSTFKIDKNKPMPNNVMPTKPKEMPRMQDGQICMGTWMRSQTFKRTWLPDPLSDQSSDEHQWLNILIVHLKNKKYELMKIELI